jgi:hypothetical protein
MKCAVEMGSGAMICMLILTKFGSGIQKLIGGIHRQTGRRSHRITQSTIHNLCLLE